MRKQAHYDTLTELPNRLLFMDRLVRAVLEAKRSGEVFALMFIDLGSVSKWSMTALATKLGMKC